MEEREKRAKLLYCGECWAPISDSFCNIVRNHERLMGFKGCVMWGGRVGGAIAWEGS